jgi:arylsulfatase A-like enzyme
MNEAIRVVALENPDVLFVALPDVDRTEHVFGPESAEARRAIVAADDEIKRLIAVAKAQGSWPETVLIVTADHGMQSVAPDPAAGRPYPLVLFGRELLRSGFGDLIPLSRGSIESVFLSGTPPIAFDGTVGERLAAVRRLALSQPEVAEAWYRLPNPADGGDTSTLAHTHPDWRLDDPQAGDLLLVARPHYQFGDPFEPSTAGVLGNHGGAEQQDIPLIVAGGVRRVRAQVIAADASSTPAANPDVGATVLWLLGMRRPHTIANTPVPEALTGRALREAFGE